jgi:hypothetical protein
MWVLFFVWVFVGRGLAPALYLWLCNLFVNAGFKIFLQGGPNAGLYLIRLTAAVYDKNVLFRF